MGWIASGSEGTLQRCIQSVFAEGLALFAINTAPHGTIKCSPQGWQNTSILGIGLRFEVRIEVEVVFANRSPNRSDFF